MKTVTFILSLFFLLGINCLYAQDQTIKLKLEKGDRFVFEKSIDYYSLREDGSKVIRRKRLRTIQVTVDSVVTDEEVIVSVRHLKYRKETYLDRNLKAIKDYFFLGFHEIEISNDIGPDYIEPLMCLFPVRFSLNLKTREIKIVDRVALLEKFYERLIEQGFKDKELKATINFINEKQLNKQKDLVSFLLWFHNTKIGTDKMLENSLLHDKFQVRDSDGKFIGFGDKDVGDLVPGKRYKKYWVNTENGVITNYSTIKADSVTSITSLSRILDNFVLDVEEVNFRMLSSGKVKPETLMVSGKIEHPLSDKIYIRFLDFIVCCNPFIDNCPVAFVTALKKRETIPAVARTGVNSHPVADESAFSF